MSNKCQWCSKYIDASNIDHNIKGFCNQDCLNENNRAYFDYNIREYISEHIDEIIREYIDVAKEILN